MSKRADINRQKRWNKNILPAHQIVNQLNVEISKRQKTMKEVEEIFDTLFSTPSAVWSNGNRNKESEAGK